jgi:hypothetical protein
LPRALLIRRLLLAPLIAIAAAGLAGCPSLKSGADLRSADGPPISHIGDGGALPSDDAAFIEGDAASSDDAASSTGLEDAAFTDAAALDAAIGDGSVLDAGDSGILDAAPRDGSIGQDALPSDGMCSPLSGQRCARAGFCGSVYDCSGSCGGGVPEPACACSPPTCQSDGHWSACPAPQNFGAPCDTTTACGGRIGCDGLTCEGGSPYPVCQCGTPTCSGCQGGTCDVNSSCMSGNCVCTSNNCGCGGVGSTQCGYCVSNALLNCGVDAYGCGALSNVAMICQFGCSDGAPACTCSPNANTACSAGPCGCCCGNFDLPGTIQCDGTCAPSQDCTTACSTFCAGIC